MNFLARSFASTLLMSFVLLAGCASGGSVVEPDSGAGDAGAGDAGTSDGSTRDGSARDGSAGDMSVGCPSGTHTCPGGMCVGDRADEVANGCRLGCGSAPCAAPTGGAAICTAAGMCDFACTAPFVRDGDTCSCTARTCAALSAMCGTPDDGCGTPLACGGCGSDSTCSSGRCVCTPDTWEPNDTEATATSIGSTNDLGDGPTITWVSSSSDDALDVDFLEVAVTDGGDGGNPHLTVTLDGMPAGTNLDLVAWYRCTAGGDSHSCTQGTAYAGAGGTGCASVSPGALSEVVEIATECSTTNESGRLVIRVATSGFGACGNYRLVVQTR